MRAVHAIIPCFNRHADLARLLADLADQAGMAGTRFRVLVVDNSSDQPISAASPDVEVLRSSDNTGGSGGFNLGMAHVLMHSEGVGPDDLIWLLDSDVRLRPDTLAELISAMDSRPDAGVVGSALGNPLDGQIFELGGRLNPRTGELGQHIGPENSNQAGELREVGYVAACSMLVRPSVTEQAGLMADVFINGDDAEWCARIRRVTGRTIHVAPRSVALHPNPDRLRTWDRALVARNAFAVIEAFGGGWRTRAARCVREIGRMLAAAGLGMDLLARLHADGLAAAAHGPRRGPIGLGSATGLRSVRNTVPELSALAKQIASEEGTFRVEPGVDTGSPAVAETLRVLREAGWREVDRGAHVAVCSARPKRVRFPRERLIVACDGEQFHVARGPRTARVIRACSLLLECAGPIALLVARGPKRENLVPTRTDVFAASGARPDHPRAEQTHGEQTHGATRLSVVVLSYNRAGELARTLGTLTTQIDRERDEIIVVDNASIDASRAVADAAGVRLLALPRNVGVLGFNIGVSHACGEYVLILDDDATPDEGVIDRALALLRSRADLAAVTFHPRHPATGASEWRFARGPSDAWPFMGCANLVRRADWLAVGGYRHEYFLYRNDTDLAMSLLARGRGVHFNPEWVAWHDSPNTGRKSARWFRIASRNWVWMCRRHGSARSAAAAIAGGACSTLLSTRARPGALISFARGLAEGVLSAPPRHDLKNRRACDPVALMLRARRAGSGTSRRTISPTAPPATTPADPPADRARAGATGTIENKEQPWLQETI